MVVDREGLLGGELSDGVGGTGELVLLVMLEEMEDSESFAMLGRIVESVSLDMLGEFRGLFSFVMLEDSGSFGMLERIVGSVSLDMLGEFGGSFSFDMLLVIGGLGGVGMLVRME